MPGNRERPFNVTESVTLGLGLSRGTERRPVLEGEMARNTLIERDRAAIVLRSLYDSAAKQFGFVPHLT